MTKRKSRTTTEPLLAGSLLREQIDLETKAIRDGVRRYRRLAREAVERTDGASLKPAERLLLHWLDALIAAIREERRACRRGETGVGRKFYGGVIVALDVERAAVVTIHEMLSMCMIQPHGVPVIKLAYAIGRACLAELNYDLLRSTKERRKIWEHLTHRIRRILPIHVNWWAKKHLDDPIWSKKVCIHLGTCLMWHLLGVASTRGYEEGVFQPAFRHQQQRSQQSPKTIRLDDDAFAVIDDGHAIRQFLHPAYLPMVIQPYPWGDDRTGGYLRLDAPLVNRGSPRQREGLANADLTKIHDAVNAVNATPWRVNQQVAKVIRYYWKTGGGILEIPHADDMPKPPFDEGKFKDAFTEERKHNKYLKQWKAEAHRTILRNRELKAERKVFIEKLAVAKLMPDRFWMPHFLDFRGRCYPVPPHLQHQGDDVCRGLLEFADGKPRNMGWLAIHACNVWAQGIDRLTFGDQYDWVNTNGEHMLAVAKAPLEQDWWQQAKKPFQFLACCFALAGDGKSCHMPIHMDGSCNGLQHYAALTRNADDAAVVNLKAAEAPSDVYTIVAESVRPLIGRDADMGHPQAQIIDPLLNRDLIKQNVMTTVYGVTAVGARKQIYRALGKVGVEGDPAYKCSHYLSRIVLKSMGHLCRGATEAMEWLRQCARAICVTGEPVEWRTPLGLPVVQPYRAYTSKAIRTVLQSVSTIFDDDMVPIEPGRQARSFPPNYIHSIDATHMLMTAQACHDAGLTFAAVHDSFWTHSADGDPLARILREQFVKLHEQPLLAELVASFRLRHPDVEFPDPPAAGDYDVTEILNARYAFK